MEASMAGLQYPPRPPGLENVAEGSGPIPQSFSLYSNGGNGPAGTWPTAPPPTNGQANKTDETQDRPDMALGKRDAGFQLQDIGETEVVYDELYEAPNLRNFDDLGLSETLTRGLYVEMQFEKPSKIQAMTLPMICSEPYPSLAAQAQNGCGKTCCFVLCILSRIDYNLGEPQALVVVPTRELAIQNASVIQKMGRHTSVQVINTSQTDEVHANPRLLTEHVVVGTHGSLRIWRRRAWLLFRSLKVVVLDEADNMIEKEGFRDDTTMMVKQIDNDTDEMGNPKSQILMFSATYRDDIREFAGKLFARGTRDAHKMWIPKEHLSLDKIKQCSVSCWGFEDKLNVLSHYILPNCEKMGKSIIFVRYRSSASELHGYLLDQGWSVTAISGAMEYSDRDTVINEFRNANTTILVSTDVLSRGFDVSDVTLVVNFDLPINRDTQQPAYETYLHRVGRTGRFKRKGAAFNLVNELRPENDWCMSEIQHYFNRDIPKLDVRDENALIAFLKKAGLTDGIPQ